MREILFRGKSEFAGIWIYGSLVKNGDDFYISENIHSYHRVVPETVGQFIGLADKNRVKIYEGDCLVDTFPVDEEDLGLGYNESLLPVVWCETQLMWCVDASFAKDGSYLTSLVEYFGDFLEVKGNIHDNPELSNK